MLWQIASYPRCERHVFLSHCAEDRSWLVHPISDELMRRQIIPWLDREDYYYGRGSRAALRDALLKSRHVVFFVTLGMLDYKRGWCPMELAYSDIIQTNLTQPGGLLLNFDLPLFFLDRGNPDLSRTAWDALRDRGLFHDPSDGDEVTWGADQIANFLHREQDLVLNIAPVVQPGLPVHNALIGRPGLVERVTRFDPSPIP